MPVAIACRVRQLQGRVALRQLKVEVLEEYPGFWST